MTEAMHDLILAGFAAGLREHAAKLFAVYINCQTQDGYDRCVLGLNSAISAYKELLRCVEQDDEAQS